MQVLPLKKLDRRVEFEILKINLCSRYSKVFLLALQHFSLNPPQKFDPQNQNFALSEQFYRMINID